MAKKDIKIEALTEKIKSIKLYLSENQGFINNMTRDTSNLIYKELKAILLLGKVYKPKPNVKIPEQFKPVKQYEECETY